MSVLTQLFSLITRFFPVWVIAAAAFAYFEPAVLSPFKTWIPYLLGLVMLGMGLTMSIDDFKLVLSRPKDVLYGIALRYLLMPFIAFSIAKLLNLPPSLAAGLILVGACPSGTASNVMTFLAKGDTALSVTVSSFNTILAPFLTPYIFLLLAGTLIPIQADALIYDILKIVLAPVLIGLILNTLFHRQVEKITTIVPVISVLSIIFIIAIVVALSAAKLATVAIIAFAAVMIHNLLGLTFGYGAPRLLGLNHTKAKAISFEIGMENSGLAVALALAHLDPVAAIPGAIFSVWHNFSGSLLAGYWGNRDSKK